MYSIRKKIMLVDNHDSFVYNLKHLVNQASGGCTDIDIMLNDEIAFTKVPQYDLAISLHSNIQARPMPRHCCPILKSGGHSVVTTLGRVVQV